MILPSQVSTLQDLDEVKEDATEAATRLEEAKRHLAALENKLESFNNQVAMAMQPIHSRCGSGGRGGG